MPAASSTWFSSISSLTIDFDLTTLLTLCSRAMSSTCWLASAASSAQSTVAPAGGDVPLELDQQLVEVGDGVALDLVGRLAPVLEVRGSASVTARLCLLERSAVSPSDFGAGRLVEPLGSGP